MQVCEEMRKLRDWLDKNNIDWIDRSEDLSIYKKDSLEPEYELWWVRTLFGINNDLISVINGHGTWGGYGITSKKNEGFLEVMGLWSGEVRGQLTCEEITEKITTKYYKAQEK